VSNYYTNLSEKELLLLLKENDSKALSALYYLHIKALKLYILKVAKSPALAEDILHDTFIKIWEYRQQINTDLPFKPFLYTVSKRLLLNLFKRAKNEKHILEEIRKYAITVENATELTVNYNESNSLLNEAISNLPTQCRAIFVKCRLGGLSYKQVSTEMGIAESTINNQMVKALKSIRKFLVIKNIATLILTFYLN
jgi:RNA polymerase sigma-70 factor (family 1)